MQKLAFTPAAIRFIVWLDFVAREIAKIRLSPAANPRKQQSEEDDVEGRQAPRERKPHITEAIRQKEHSCENQDDDKCGNPRETGTQKKQHHENGNRHKYSQSQRCVPMLDKVEAKVEKRTDEESNENRQKRISFGCCRLHARNLTRIR
jgi:hypothetical protein